MAMTHFTFVGPILLRVLVIVGITHLVLERSPGLIKLTATGSVLTSPFDEFLYSGNT